MINFRLKIFTLINLICICASGQTLDFVKILPGRGIVYNNDSILLYKSTMRDVCNILKIKEKVNPKEILLRHWDGYNSQTLESTSGTEYFREIKFKSLVFEFSDEKDRNHLKLKWIRTKDDKTLKIYTEKGLVMGMINPQINVIYPILQKIDYVSDNKMTYNLYTYGISIQLAKLMTGDLQIMEISTHYIIK